jgi:hypothetical protein
MTAALLCLVAGAAFAADNDQTGQAGQYQANINATRVKGTGADFAPSTVWVPFILRNDATTGAASVNSQLNGAIAERIGGVGYGAVTTFGATGAGTPGTNAPRIVAMLGTVDGDPRLSSLTSNNTIVDEGSRNLSNSLGSLLPDGTITFSERFGTGTGFAQNNLAGFNAAHTLGVAAAIGAPNKIVASTSVNYGNAGETAINTPTATVLGSAFIGVTASVRDPNRPALNDENLLTANTTFNGNPTLTAAQRAAATNGVVIFDGLNNDPTSVLGPTVVANCNVAPGIANLYTPGVGTLAYWLQAGVPMPTNPAGECFADARQTKPALAVVRTPSGADVPYQIHGVGFSGGTPFSGGSARPLYLVVDSVYAPGSTTVGRTGYTGSIAAPNLANNSIIIEADAAGAIHGRPLDATFPTDPGFADHFSSDPNLSFVDAQATGGGGGQSTLSQFDMNSRGQVAALWANEGIFPRQYEVRVYDPIFNAAGNRIEGYTLGRTITFTGDATTGIVDRLTTTAETAPGTFQDVGLVPISGVSIADNGRVAFYAATERFEELGDFDANPFTPDTTFLNNTTNTVFVYDQATDTLHTVLKGGQNGDVLADAFPASGNPLNESLALGFFPVDAASDTMGRNSLSNDGTLLAINFRSGGNETLNGVNVELEFRPGSLLPDTFRDRGGVLTRGSGATLNERAVRGTVIIGLGNLVTAPVCCPGDADGSTTVTFGDITSVLANFGATYSSGQGAGDANCDLTVTFADITSVLANFGSSCN